MQSPEHKGFNAFEQTQQHLRQTFREYLIDRVGIQHNAPLKILSVGSRFAEDAEPLVELFPQSTYEGIEVNRSELKATQLLYGDNPRILFREANARQKEELGEPHDLVIMRHPQPQGSLMVGQTRESATTPSAWREIFENSIDNLTPQGILFVSSYDEGEARRVLNFVSDSLDVIVHAEQNKFVSVRDRYMDSVITIGRKS